MATRRKRKGPKVKKRNGRLNLLIDPTLKSWAKKYAERRGTTVTTLIISYFKELQEEEKSVGVEQI